MNNQQGFVITYSHGDADKETKENFLIRTETDSEMRTAILRELMYLKECILTARSSGRDSHLPESLRQYGYVVLPNGQHFYPELDFIFDQRDLYAAIENIEPII